MLGRAIHDPTGIESRLGEVAGLGLLPVVTRFDSHKETHQVSGRVAADHGLLKGARGLELEGYEIHMGSSDTEGGGPPPPSTFPGTRAARRRRATGRSAPTDGRLARTSTACSTTRS